MPNPTCNFVKYDGVLCGSPALRGGDYCYFHTRQMASARYGARVAPPRSSPPCAWP